MKINRLKELEEILKRIEKTKKISESDLDPADPEFQKEVLFLAEKISKMPLIKIYVLVGLVDQFKKHLRI